MDLLLPKGARVARVEMLTPENEQAARVDFAVDRDRLHCKAPSILVYGVLRIEFAP